MNRRSWALHGQKTARGSKAPDGAETQGTISPTAGHAGSGPSGKAVQ